MQSGLFVSDALVRVIGPSSSYVLRDTLYARTDTSRYSFPMQAYYASDFVPQYDATYEVVASSPELKTATGSTIIPGKATLTIYSSTQVILRLPERNSADELIELVVHSDGRARGYVCRMYVYYDVLKDGQWIEERSEVPISSISGTYTLEGARYPTLTRRPDSGDHTIYFRNGFYRAVIDYVTYTSPRAGSASESIAAYLSNRSASTALSPGAAQLCRTSRGVRRPGLDRRFSLLLPAWQGRPSPGSRSNLRSADSRTTAPT